MQILRKTFTSEENPRIHNQK